MVEGNQVIISSIHDLLIHIGKVELGTASWNGVVFTSIALPVRVCGNNWDKYFDIRGATLVRDWQKETAKLYKDTTGNSLPTSGRVKAYSEDGSNLLNIELGETCNTMLANLPPEYNFTLLLSGILGFVGYKWYGHYVTKCKDKNDAETTQKALDCMADVAKKAIEGNQDPTLPMRKYFHSLNASDKVSVAGGEPLPKKEALQKLDRPAKDDRQVFTQCDGDYELVSINVSGKYPVVSIAQNGVVGKAMFFERVPKAVKEEIIAALEARMPDSAEAAAAAPVMSLQVDGYFTGNRIQYFVILGIGAPRVGTNYTIAQLPREVAASDKKIPGINN